MEEKMEEKIKAEKIAEENILETSEPPPITILTGIPYHKKPEQGMRSFYLKPKKEKHAQQTNKKDAEICILLTQKFREDPKLKEAVLQGTPLQISCIPDPYSSENYRLQSYSILEEALDKTSELNQDGSKPEAQKENFINENEININILERTTKKTTILFNSKEIELNSNQPMFLTTTSFPPDINKVQIVISAVTPDGKERKLVNKTVSLQDLQGPNRKIDWNFVFNSQENKVEIEAKSGNGYKVLDFFIPLLEVDKEPPSWETDPLVTARSQIVNNLVQQAITLATTYYNIQSLNHKSPPEPREFIKNFQRMFYSLSQMTLPLLKEELSEEQIKKALIAFFRAYQAFQKNPSDLNQRSGIINNARSQKNNYVRSRVVTSSR